MSNFFRKHKTVLLISLALPLQVLLLQLLKSFPQFVEDYYSNGLYPLLSKISRYLFGWVPFSVGDLFYLIVIILAFRWFYKNVKRLRSGPIAFFLDITATLSIVYFLFHILWGLNYYRIPLHKTLQLDNEYTTEELIATTKRLIEKSNNLHNSLGFKDSTKIDLPYSQEEIFKMTKNGYDNVSSTYPNLNFQPQSLKKSGWSTGLSYMGYSGYLNPLSNEAQVNNLIKTYKFPVVSCHEQAHQLGYAAENEANFIAALTTINNDETYIKYSGYIFTLRYCINEIARRDIDVYHELLPTINFGILESYREMREFWASYANPFEGLSKAFYNQFLKANNQAKGIKSYSYMVALIVNYYEDREF